MSEVPSFEITEATMSALKDLSKVISGASEYLPRWTRYAFLTESTNFARYVKDVWLYSKINRGTGLTERTINPFVPARYRREYKSGTIYFNVHPGVGVMGSLNYHGGLASPRKMVYGQYRQKRNFENKEFMKPAAIAYLGSHDVAKIVADNFDTGIQYLKRKEGVR